MDKAHPKDKLLDSYQMYYILTCNIKNNCHWLKLNCLLEYLANQRTLMSFTRTSLVIVCKKKL